MTSCYQIQAKVIAVIEMVRISCATGSPTCDPGCKNIILNILCTGFGNHFPNSFWMCNLANYNQEG